MSSSSSREHSAGAILRPTCIIVHCSDSHSGTAADIDRWHLARGWRGIGYHWVIRGPSPGPDGLLEAGRPETVPGAHCTGYNARSIGVCLIGRGAYSAAQMETLKALLLGIMGRHQIPPERVLGHCETASGRAQGKTCPLVDMAALRTELRQVAP